MSKRRKLYPEYRKKALRSRKVAVSVTLHAPQGERAKFGFEACARVKGGQAHCGYGRNPRKATASALTALAKHLRRRKGAYRGIR